MSSNPASTSAKEGLTRWQAIPLAVGSIAGSGILFLPSAVYARSGDSSMLVWALSIVLCLPMLLMFDDMVRDNPDGRGIEAFIRLGLGDRLARCVPIMFVALVIVGLPSGAFVAGRYVAETFDLPRAALIGVAVAVLISALAVSRAGMRASSHVQTATTWALVIMATVLLVSALPGADSGLEEVLPSMQNLGVILPTVVLAFWAFAGFENLTFLAREFRNPRRDFLLVATIALAIYGLFTILLTAAIAATVDREEVDEVVGLLQLATTAGYVDIVLWIVTIIACSAMLLNAIAWVWGASGLVRDAADNRMLPAVFATSAGPKARSRGLGLLAVLFCGTTVLLSFRPSLVVDTTAAASAIFLILYIFSIASYFRVRGVTWRALLNLILLVVFVIALVQSLWHTLYGVVVMIAALAVQALRPATDPRSPRPSPERP